MKFPNAERKPDARQPIHDAYEEVFDSPCCFQRMQDPHTLRLGRAVVHQALIHHLREDGPYHSDHQPRVERVHSELGRRRQAGTRAISILWNRSSRLESIRKWFFITAEMSQVASLR